MQPIGENTANIPAFLGKLWKMVNDPNSDHLICWSPAGNSFVIQNQAQFWYELLPLYYKHNNMSSFVRQLNMYGFHKMSTVENGTMDSDKDEIQFYHPFFQKDQPELLKNIKRKVTAHKTNENNMQNIVKHDDIAKVLTDVKQLRGRQTSIDSQLSAMKQENAVLWRELALLRQKHIKQQQIVNKLIQFLVTLVRPSATSRMGVGVKRRMPLMLYESPAKKLKNKKPSSIHDNSDGGPTIHELDSEIEILPEELFEQEVEETPMVTSPMATTQQSTVPTEIMSQPSPACSSNDGNNETGLPENFWDKPEFVEINQLQPDDLLMSDNDLTEESINDLQSNTNRTNEKVFLNPTARDTLLSNLVNGSYNSNVLNGKNLKKISNSLTENANNRSVDVNPENNSDMTVATRDVRINSGCYRRSTKIRFAIGWLSTTDLSQTTHYKPSSRDSAASVRSEENERVAFRNRDDLDMHLESTQSEIDQLKDILHGCNTLDANALLGLFNDEAPAYGLPCSGTTEEQANPPPVTADPMVSGTELATCGNNLIDFNELFDDSLDGQDTVSSLPDTNSTVNTPLVVKSEPVFPMHEKEL